MSFIGNNRTILGTGAVVFALGIIWFLKSGAGTPEATNALAGGNLVIPKSQVTESAKFYTYQAGQIKMEVLAVKAPDGTIRTAFNTCQVCYDSGRGYYKQQGDELVCQNCGNRFKTSQVEKIKGGCNPVPIMANEKTDDGTNITIKQDFLVQNVNLFVKWKKG